MAKIIIVIFLVAIVTALMAGMVFLVKDDGESKRTVRALTWRISLSLALIALLVIGYAAGWIQPHGVMPR
ncbi:twin transmembrane helix small protein [Spectribacter hydrogenoxidans]|uniref:Twin transmembrane helix small protein n=1 Tax=Spectribacter hydrogenoxidans TaxID=3075608 RepID=A0ABU3BYN4_9GAMM|nr:twin transmembrane helix small protein [Salinisphaera sp. W335]MDT0634234.1 twin transmembrane helix small protein [Salinisphaera sp. W335]